MFTERHRYEYDIDVNGSSAAAAVIRMAGTGKRILEIGAGPGSITKILQQQRGCRVTALEIDPSAIKILRNYCERVVQGDLNHPSWTESFRGADPFEVVMIADVLEHLYDPLGTLRSIKQCVGPGGYIVVSLPHAGHASIHACLFHEDLSYQDWGLLDRTHIRFFGLKNMQKLFEEAGYKITDAKFIIVHPEEDIQFYSQWDSLPSEFKRAVQLNKFSNVYQVVIQAVPSDTPSKGLQLMSMPTGGAHISRFNWLRKLLLNILVKKGNTKTWEKLSRLKARMIAKFQTRVNSR